MLAPGAMVGEYQITHKLGEGGMGVVYAGMHPEIGKRVAIKVLAPHAAVYPDLIRRFKEEARAVNKIRHPNIIDIFAFNQLQDGRHYFVMEYLDGESLTARLERGQMELAEMRRLLGQICSALQAAHEAGVIHRDLKPDNIWVATQRMSASQQVGESRIKLLDFGIAKLNDTAVAKATQAGVAMGTPHYMPPEQGMGRVVDHRTDIYALGVILYQVFAGRLPFDGGTAQEIIFKHVTEPPRPPSQHRPIAPKAMEGIILDCLQKEPERRPPSVQDLALRIEAAFSSGTSRSVGADVDQSIARTEAPKVARGAEERLPEAGPRVPGAMGSTASPATTMGGLTGQVATRPSDEHGPGEARLLGRRAWWRRPAVVAIGGAAAVVAVVTLGGHRPFSGTTPPAQPASVVPAAAAPAPTVAKAVVAAAPREAPPPPEPSAPPPEKAPPPTALPVAASVPPPPTAGVGATPIRAKRDHARKEGRAKKPAVAEPPPPARHEAPPAGQPQPTAKPNCTTKFYFDAQGDKHFKPECF